MVHQVVQNGMEHFFKGKTGLVLWYIGKCGQSLWYKYDACGKRGRHSGHLAYLDFLPGLRGCEYTGVNNASHCKRPTNNGTDSCNEAVDWLSPLCVFHCNGTQIVTEPNGWDYATRVTVGHVLLIGHSVLIGKPLLS